MTQLGVFREAVIELTEGEFLALYERVGPISSPAGREIRYHGLVFTCPAHPHLLAETLLRPALTPETMAKVRAAWKEQEGMSQGKGRA